MTRNLALLTLLTLLTPVLCAQNHMVSVPCCLFVDSVSGNSTTTVPVGTTVQWNLQGAVAHTVTSGTGSSAPNVGALFDQPLNTQNPTFTFTFNQPGVFPYFCRPHEFLGMNGTVVVTVPASVTSTGTGCTGASGQPLTLSANGLPQIGNQAFSATLSNGPPNGQAFLFLSFGLAPAPIPVTPSCSLFLDPTSFNNLISLGVSPIGPLGLDGSGAVTVPAPIGSGNQQMGTTFDVQAAAPDATVPGGVVTSNALTLVIGI